MQHFRLTVENLTPFYFQFSIREEIEPISLAGIAARVSRVSGAEPC
jgi:hypothetical protein